MIEIYAVLLLAVFLAMLILEGVNAVKLVIAHFRQRQNGGIFDKRRAGQS
jgi:hypothetical protein